MKMNRIVTMASLLVALAACPPATFSADVASAEATILTIEPKVAADVDCVIEALASDPNILDPVDDLVLAPAVFACFVTTDGGPSITGTQAVALAKTHRATAAKKAVARQRKAVTSSASVPILDGGAG